MKDPDSPRLHVAQKIEEVLNHEGGASLSPEAAALLRLAIKACRTGKRPSQETIDNAVDDEYMKLGKSGPVHSRYKIWKEHAVQVSRKVQTKAAALGVTHGEFMHALRCPAPGVAARGVYRTYTHASGRFSIMINVIARLVVDIKDLTDKHAGHEKRTK